MGAVMVDGSSPAISQPCRHLSWGSPSLGAEHPSSNSPLRWGSLPISWGQKGSKGSAQTAEGPEKRGCKWQGLAAPAEAS